jgi:DNA-directed RNA polymerase specialized sigma24 family protein
VVRYEGSHPAPLASVPAAGEPGAQAVADALAALPAEQREVLVCTFYEQLSADQAAERLGIAVSDVKRYAGAALIELRRLLQARGVPIPRQPAALPAPRQPAA